MPKRFALGIVPVNRLHEAVSRAVIALIDSTTTERVEFGSHPRMIVPAMFEAADVVSLAFIVRVFERYPKKEVVRCHAILIAQEIY
jgi:hypothetical protein